MVEWFHANYEHPDEHTPYETAEGGYQWIWGGPYQAAEELAEYFADAEENEIEEAATRLQDENGIYDWAPNDARVQPDDYEDQPDPEPLEDRIAALRGDLDDLERHIDALRDEAPQMGHNGPPDDMRLGIDQRDLDEARESISEIRAELDRPDPVNTADVAPLAKAEGRFRALAGKVMGWMKVTGKALVLGAVGEMGAELWGDPSAFFIKLETVANTLGSWVGHLQLPF